MVGSEYLFVGKQFKCLQANVLIIILIYGNLHYLKSVNKVAKKRTSSIRPFSDQHCSIAPVRHFSNVASRLDEERGKRLVYYRNKRI